MQRISINYNSGNTLASYHNPGGDTFNNIVVQADRICREGYANAVKV